MSTALICILLLVVAVFGIKSYMKRLAYGCCSSGGKDPSHYPYRRIMKVDGMSCDSCAVRVENALNSLEGVWARVDLKTKEADIRASSALLHNTSTLSVSLKSMTNLLN